MERKPINKSITTPRESESPSNIYLSRNESIEAKLSESSYPVVNSPISEKTHALQTDNNEGYEYDFENAYHPVVHEYIKYLNRDGINGLLRRSVQQYRRESLLFTVADVERYFFETKDKKKVKSLFDKKHYKFVDYPTINEIHIIGWNLRDKDNEYIIMEIDDKLSFHQAQKFGENILLFYLEKNECKKILDEKKEEKIADEFKKVFKNHNIELDGKINIEKIADLWEIVGQIETEFRCFVSAKEDRLFVFQDFNQLYSPLNLTDKQVIRPPEGITDFTPGGFFSQYNWEMFFHAPLMIADRLSKNQRFEEAQQWFHYIFDPIDCSMYSPPHRYWQVLPFFNEVRGKTIQELMVLLGDKDENKDNELTEAKQGLVKQLNLWKNDPFEPHLIAQLRPAAYQKTVVMRYLDNLITWGDQLFRRDSIETIGEATQLYILAAEILGKRPIFFSQPWDTPARTFEQMKMILDEFSNGPVLIEEYLTDTNYSLLGSGTNIMTALGSSLHYACVPDYSISDPVPYFLVPQNEKLLSYWDTVSDRLFKIRHCLNIEGVERKLLLFEPPIEPGLLVRAKAAGLDLQDILADISVPFPNYRFSVLLKKAKDFCQDVRAFGAAFLSVLEKRDAEDLTKLRMNQEGPDLNWIKQKHVEEAKDALASLEKAKEIKETSKTHVEQEPDPEDHTLNLLYAEKVSLALASSGYLIASFFSKTPEIYTGGAGVSSPVGIVKTGGKSLAAPLDKAAKGSETISQILGMTRNIMEETYKRKLQKDEKEHKKEIISKEIEQMELQIEAGKIRVDIAEKELENYKREVENNKEIYDYLSNKFTNLELYNWMVSELSLQYFKSYQMAYDLAKRAEKAFQNELGRQDSKFIQFGYWDSLNKGLVAGDKLLNSLKLMETAYLEENKRDYEITKHISLSKYFPAQLKELRKGGKCDLKLEEWLFELDYPRHYMRRIKSVSLTILCEAGPYTNVNCTLTLNTNSVRNKPSPDKDLTERIGAVQSIATSTAKNDCGMFKLDFSDERYLPFEGAGAISEWSIELPQKNNRINIKDISEIIIHMNYTSREGGEDFGKKVEEKIINKLSEQPLALIIDCNQDFSQRWDSFINNTEKQGFNLDLPLDKTLFPAMFQGRKINLNDVYFFMIPNEKHKAGTFSLPFTFKTGKMNEVFIKEAESSLEPQHYELTDTFEADDWKIIIDKDNAVRMESLENMLIWIWYKVS
ncbi:MAG: hypothetical protein JSW07_01400 [bacterium]|nr:MAG: hypothetical protein JSW07_01400 [bacterium]